MKKAFKILLVVMAVVMLLTTVVSASSPYTTYTYSSTGFVLNSPDAYTPDVVVDAPYMGGNLDFSAPADIAIGHDDKVYVSDSKANCIYVLDKYYKHLFTIQNFDNEQGVPDGFAGISGLFVNENYIYACDTENARIVIFKLDGTFVKTVLQPSSALFNADTIYRPVAIAVDSYGRLFIVSSTSYEGIIVMSDMGDFYGYIGAQKVAISAWDAFWREIRPESAVGDEFVSTEYNNITIDDKNFIYVTTSTIDESAQQNAITGRDKSGTYAPVKKLNASGMDVMARNGFYPPSGEVKISTSETSTISGPSAIVDAAVGPEGSWSIIDQKRSKVFTYDSNGNLLFAFGDSGNQIGSIAEVKAVTYHGDKLILLDKGNGSFTVYRRTEYGDILIKALENQNSRNYSAEVDDWREILKRNNNFDVAYIGIASAMYRDGNYEGAMEYYKAAYDNGGYSNSFKEVRKDWMAKWFLVIPVVVVVALLLVSNFLGYAAKKNKEVSLKVGQKNIREELIYAFHIMTHPFDGFWDLKHEKRGSVRSAYIILVITILAFFYQAVGTGYIFAGETAGVDVFMTLASVSVPLLLWVISNWCLTTLFDGEGTLKDVFIASCYSLIPLPLFIIPTTLVYNVLVTEEASMISLINGIAFMWMGVLIFFGMMITHGYSVGKGAVTALGTIVGMVFIMFIAVLFSTLITKVISFVYSIADEINYRM